MKCRSHRSSHTAVLGDKPFKRSHRVGIADYARDCPAACSIGGLTLGRSLGLDFQLSGQQFAGFHDFIAAEQAPVMRGHVEADAAQNLGAVEPADRCGRGWSSSAWAADVVGAGGDGGGFGVVHVVPRVGPIPTMWQSSHVTSDTSTTVRREVSTWN